MNETRIDLRAQNPERKEKIKRTAELMFAFNNAPMFTEQHEEALAKLFPLRGKNCFVHPPIYINIAENLHLGSNVAINPYFKCMATGTTKAVAEQIAKITDSDLIEIQPKQPYTAADLNWHDNNSRTTKEKNDRDGIRPEIANKIDVSGYDTIYLGYPIWWGQAPNILYTLVEGVDLTGKTIYPFCTSGSSSVGSSATNLAKKAPKATWKNGKRFSGKVNENDIKGWK